MTSKNDMTTKDIQKLIQERIDQETAERDAERVEKEKSKITSKLITDCLVAEEYGDGVLFAALNEDKFLYCKNMQEWFEWNGIYWQRDIMGRALAAVEDVVEQYLLEYSRVSSQITQALADGEEEKTAKLKLKQSQLFKRAARLRRDKGRTNCLKFAHTIETPLAVAGDEFDREPMLLPCSNAVIDLQRGVPCNRPRPEDYLSLASPTEWKGFDEPCPRFERFLSEICGGNDDLVSFLRRFFGYSITGLSSEHRFLVLWGHGRNGKTVLVTIISYILGPLARSIPAEMLLDQKLARSSAGPSPDIMLLKGLRLAFASESEEGRRFNAARIKLFTGGDELMGRSPHDKYFSHFDPTHTLVLLTNDKPQAPAWDFAFWERLLLMPFTIAFVDREPQQPHERRAQKDLIEALKAESSGILAWLVRGCLEWQRYGLDPPDIVREQTEQYRRDEDLLSDFIEDRCIIEPGAAGGSSEIYAEFESWYQQSVGVKVPTQRWLGKQLRRRFERVKRDGRMVYLGITVV